MKKNKKKFTALAELGKRLRLVRKQKGLSQTEFAKKLGYKTSASVSNIEKGKTPPDVLILKRAAELLDVDIHWLITGKPSPLAVQFAEHVMPCVAGYVTKLNEEIKELRQQVTTLSIEQIYEGQDKKEQIEKISKKISQKQLEADSLSDAFICIRSGEIPDKENPLGIRRYKKQKK